MIELFLCEGRSFIHFVPSLFKLLVFILLVVVLFITNFTSCLLYIYAAYTVLKFLKCPAEINFDLTRTRLRLPSDFGGEKSGEKEKHECLNGKLRKMVRASWELHSSSL